MPRYATYQRVAGRRAFDMGRSAAAGGGGAEAGLVDAYMGQGDNLGDLTSNSTTFADFVSVTVPDTEVDDLLEISLVAPCYTPGGAAICKFQILVDGAAVRVGQLGYSSLPIVPGVHVWNGTWRYVIGAGDITAGNTIVKGQYAKMSGLEAVSIVNRSEGLPTISVIRIRAAA